MGNNYVDVSITLETNPPSQVGFGTTLILTTAAIPAFGGDLVRSYEDLDAVKVDMASSTAAYKAAERAFAQKPRPAKVMIGVAIAPVAGVGVVTLAGDLVAGNKASVTVNGTPVETTFATSAAATLTALGAAIAALDSVATATVDTVARTITITTVVGYPLAVSAIAVTGGATQTTGAYAETTPAVTLPDSLDELVQENDDWYGLYLADVQTKANILNVAAWAEPRLKIFAASTSDAEVAAGTAGNVLLLLEEKAYDRTFVEYTDTPADHPLAGLLASQLAELPGAATWMYKTIVGATPENLTATERANILDHKGNIHTTQKGVNMFEPGVMVSGQFIDVIHSRDWLEARLAQDVFELLARSKKISYTNKGAGAIEAVIRKCLDEAVSMTILTDDQPYTVTIPKVSAQSPSDRANRRFPGIKFNGTIAGAIHTVQVRGTVSV
ncbi:hypothetical protein D3C72_718180 [compost metagenome]